MDRYKKALIAMMVFLCIVISDDAEAGSIKKNNTDVNRDSIVAQVDREKSKEEIVSLPSQNNIALATPSSLETVGAEKKEKNSTDIGLETEKKLNEYKGNSTELCIRFITKKDGFWEIKSIKETDNSPIRIIFYILIGLCGLSIFIFAVIVVDKLRYYEAKKH